MEEQIRILADWNEKHANDLDSVEQIRLNCETINLLAQSINTHLL